MSLQETMLWNTLEASNKKVVVWLNILDICKGPFFLWGQKDIIEVSGIALHAADSYLISSTTNNFPVHQEEWYFSTEPAVTWVPLG